MLTELYLAGKYLRPRRNMVSIIALMSILGVMLGVMVLIVVMAVMTGFTDAMKEKLIETQAHFQIRAPGGWLSFPEQAVNVVKSHGGDASPVIQGAVLVQYGYNKRRLDTQAVIFAAPQGDLEKHIDTRSYIKAGSFKLGREGRKSYAVISTDMAERWDIGIGDTFLVHSAKRLTDLVKFNANGKVELNQDSSVYLPTEFTVSGIYSAGKSDFDCIVFFADLGISGQIQQTEYEGKSCPAGIVKTTGIPDLSAGRSAVKRKTIIFVDPDISIQQQCIFISAGKIPDRLPRCGGKTIMHHRSIPGDGKAAEKCRKKKNPHDLSFLLSGYFCPEKSVIYSESSSNNTYCSQQYLRIR